MKNVRLRLPGGGSYLSPQASSEFPVVDATQTGVTSKWTGISKDISSLRDGVTINYWLPYDSEEDATLDITLSDGTQTGEINCYIKGNTRLGTQYGAGDMLFLTYRENVSVNGEGSYTGWWAEADYNTDNYYSLTLSNEVYCKGNVSSGALIVGDNGGYQNLQDCTSFDLEYPVLYHVGNVIGGANTSANDTFYVGLVDPTKTFANSSLTAKSLVYIKGTVDGSVFTPYKAELLTTTLPTEVDGYYYMLVGYIGTNTSSMTLLPTHPVYVYNESGIVRYINGVAAAVDTSVFATIDYVQNNIKDFATTEFVTKEITNTIATADAMIYKGTIGEDATVTELPAEHKVGWTYKVKSAGVYAGQSCEVGDMIICSVEGTEADDSHWDVIQANNDGAVTGPSSSVIGNIAVFDSITGKVIADSGIAIPSKDALANDKVNVSVNVTGKAFVTGVLEGSDNNTELVMDTGIYLDTVSGQLTAESFKGNLIGNADSATKALQDGNGNVIADTYATKAQVPSYLSQLINDADFITSSGSISGNAATATSAITADIAMKDSAGNVITDTYATLESPVFVGVPLAPTADKGTNTDQIATTAFVTQAIADAEAGELTSVEWEIIQNKPETFAPSEHTHNAEDIELLHVVAISGNYKDLEDAPTVVSAFENDALYVTKDTDITGTAAKAAALSSSAGSINTPVYFKDGKPVTLGYTLESNVPSDAKFTDTTYSVATGTVDGLMSAEDKAKLDNITYATMSDIDSLFD